MAGQNNDESPTANEPRRSSVVPKYKLVFVGDENVGKTTIILRYVNGDFESTYQPTIGVDFLTKSVYKENDMRIKLQLWDTAGQERFRSLIPSYIRNTHCACLIFDMSSRKSFDNVDFWFKNLTEYCSNITQIQTVLIANKSDLQEQRQVSSTELQEKADNYSRES